MANENPKYDMQAQIPTLRGSMPEIIANLEARDNARTEVAKNQAPESKNNSYLLNNHTTAKRAVLTTLVVGMTYFSAGCANTKPFVEARTNGNGALEARAGIRVGGKSQKNFYQRHKKGIWVTTGLAVAGGIAYALSNRGGDEAPSQEHPTEDQGQTPDQPYTPNQPKTPEEPEPDPGHGTGGD